MGLMLSDKVGGTVIRGMACCFASCCGEQKKTCIHTRHQPHRLASVHTPWTLCSNECLCACAVAAGMPQPGGLAGLFQDAGDSALREPQREAAVLSTGLPHVIVKTGIIKDVPGGSSSIEVAPWPESGSNKSNSGQCSISREDLASAVVASAVCLPGLGRSSSSNSIVFEVQDNGPGQPPESWEQLLESLAAARV